MAREDDRAGFVGSALRTAVVLDEAEIARRLLSPLRMESMRRGHVAPLVRLATRYGEPWLAELLRVWFGEGRAWGFPRPDAPSRRDERLASPGAPLAALLAAAATADAPGLRDEVVRFAGEQGDTMTACLLATLRRAAKFPREMRRDGDFEALAAHCATRLRARSDSKPRADDDWSIELPDGCACDLCETLGTFLHDPARRMLEWPIAKDRRQHVHSRIDAAELPVDHMTRRQGRPYTLVLTKSPDLFERTPGQDA